MRHDGTSPLALILAVAAGCAVAGQAGEALAGPHQPGILATVWKWAPLIGSGFLLNLIISLCAMFLGTALGVMVGLSQLSPISLIRYCAWAITQFFRNAPWLVLLFYAILTLPYEVVLAGTVITLPPTLKATIGLALPVMGNVSEIVRGGVQSIPATQWESAEALAFNRRQTLWLIVLPQCAKRMIPPWMNLYAVLTMATPLVSVVGVEEAMSLTRRALSAESRPELLLPMYFLLLLAFFAYCFPIARLTAALERRLGERA